MLVRTIKNSVQAGFTMIEMMVAIAVLAITVTIAVPSFLSATNSSRLTTSANESLAVLQLARMEAIRMGRRTVACLVQDPNAATPTCGTSRPKGWAVFVDANRDNIYSEGERLLRVAQLPGKIELLGSPSFSGGIAFHPDGLAWVNIEGEDLLTASVDFCLPTNHPKRNVRRLSIVAGSRFSVESLDSNGGCSTPGDGV